MTASRLSLYLVVRTATNTNCGQTGEPLPAAKVRGASAFSGTLNAGETFELTASPIAGGEQPMRALCAW